MAHQTEIFYGETDSPIGLLTIYAAPSGILKIEFGSFKDTAPHVTLWAKKHHIKGEFVFNRSAVRAAVQQLDEYFRGRRFHFDLPLVLKGTVFQKTVWKELMNIPYGETRTYRDIARAIKAPKAVRAVGSANNKNPLPIIIPCHRVIGSNGALVGYGGGLQKKEILLDLEKSNRMIS